MTGLRIDRTRAIKVGAAAGLALLAISILPGLLRPPAPPELPADVGFAPAETAGTPVRAAGVGPAKPRKPAISGRQRLGEGHARRDLPKDRRADGHSSSPRPSRQPSPAPAPDPPPDPDPPTASTPGQYSPPPTVHAPPPPTSPAPPPPPSAPADGSQEFAPR